MTLTISTHDAGQSQAHRAHNIRDPRAVSNQRHIDPAGHFEVWVDRDIRHLYDERFGASVARYNAFQERSDRRIKSYYDQVRKSSQMSCVREMIVSVGNSRGNHLSHEEERAILRDFMSNWEERNASKTGGLCLVSCVLHQDEPGARSHLHIQYFAWYDVPLPALPERRHGLDRRAGLVGALRALGFEKAGRETAQIQWVRRENTVLQNLVEARGHEVIHPQSHQHMETRLYKLETKHRELKERYSALLSSYRKLLELPEHVEQSIQREASKDASFTR